MVTLSCRPWTADYTIPGRLARPPHPASLRRHFGQQRSFFFPCWAGRLHSWQLRTVGGAFLAARWSRLGRLNKGLERRLGGRGTGGRGDGCGPTGEDGRPGRGETSLIWTSTSLAFIQIGRGIKLPDHDSANILCCNAVKGCSNVCILCCVREAGRTPAEALWETWRRTLQTSICNARTIVTTINSTPGRAICEVTSVASSGNQVNGFLKLNVSAGRFTRGNTPPLFIQSDSKKAFDCRNLICHSAMQRDGRTRITARRFRMDYLKASCPSLFSLPTPHVTRGCTTASRVS